jgi:hypothetical protein
MAEGHKYEVDIINTSKKRIIISGLRMEGRLKQLSPQRCLRWEMKLLRDLEMRLVNSTEDGAFIHQSLESLPV